jgi:hypothetical protein
MISTNGDIFSMNGDKLSIRWLNKASHWLKAFNEKGRNRYLEEEFTKLYDRTTTFSGQSTAEDRFPCCSMDHADFYLCFDF